MISPAPDSGDRRSSQPNELPALNPATLPTLKSALEKSSSLDELLPLIGLPFSLDPEGLLSLVDLQLAERDPLWKVESALFFSIAQQRCGETHDFHLQQILLELERRASFEISIQLLSEIHQPATIKELLHAADAVLAVLAQARHSQGACELINTSLFMQSPLKRYDLAEHYWNNFLGAFCAFAECRLEELVDEARPGIL